MKFASSLLVVWLVCVAFAESQATRLVSERCFPGSRWSTPGLEETCGFTPTSRLCKRRVRRKRAKKLCLEQGGRLCSRREILAGEVFDDDKTTGCGINNRFIWTSSICSGRPDIKFFAVRANGDGKSICKSGKTNSAFVRCCYDMEQIIKMTFVVQVSDQLNNKAIAEAFQSAFGAVASNSTQTDVQVLYRGEGRAYIQTKVFAKSAFFSPIIANVSESLNTQVDPASCFRNDNSLLCPLNQRECRNPTFADDGIFAKFAVCSCSNQVAFGNPFEVSQDEFNIPLSASYEENEISVAYKDYKGDIDTLTMNFEFGEFVPGSCSTGGAGKPACETDSTTCTQANKNLVIRKINNERDVLVQVPPQKDPMIKTVVIHVEKGIFGILLTKFISVPEDVRFNPKTRMAGFGNDPVITRESEEEERYIFDDDDENVVSPLPRQHKRPDPILHEENDLTIRFGTASEDVLVVSSNMLITCEKVQVDHLNRAASDGPSQYGSFSATKELESISDSALLVIPSSMLSPFTFKECSSIQMEANVNLASRDVDHLTAKANFLTFTIPEDNDLSAQGTGTLRINHGEDGSKAELTFTSYLDTSNTKPLKLSLQREWNINVDCTATTAIESSRGVSQIAKNPSSLSRDGIFVARLDPSLSGSSCALTIPIGSLQTLRNRAKMYATLSNSFDDMLNAMNNRIVYASFSKISSSRNNRFLPTYITLNNTDDVSEVSVNLESNPATVSLGLDVDSGESGRLIINGTAQLSTTPSPSLAHDEKDGPGRFVLSVDQSGDFSGLLEVPFTLVAFQNSNEEVLLESELYVQAMDTLFDQASVDAYASHGIGSLNRDGWGDHEQELKVDVRGGSDLCSKISEITYRFGSFLHEDYDPHFRLEAIFESQCQARKRERILVGFANFADGISSGFNDVTSYGTVTMIENGETDDASFNIFPPVDFRQTDSAVETWFLEASFDSFTVDAGGNLMSFEETSGRTLLNRELAEKKKNKGKKKKKKNSAGKKKKAVSKINKSSDSGERIGPIGRLLQDGEAPTAFQPVNLQFIGNEELVSVAIALLSERDEVVATIDIDDEHIDEQDRVSKLGHRVITADSSMNLASTTRRRRLTNRTLDGISNDGRFGISELLSGAVQGELTIPSSAFDQFFDDDPVNISLGVRTGLDDFVGDVHTSITSQTSFVTTKSAAVNARLQGGLLANSRGLSSHGDDIQFADAAITIGIDKTFAIEIANSADDGLVSTDADIVTPTFDCVTDGGGRAPRGIQCVFPVTIEGIEYSNCIPTSIVKPFGFDGSDGFDLTWCPTTSNYGPSASKKNKWGYCECQMKAKPLRTVKSGSQVEEPNRFRFLQDQSPSQPSSGVVSIVGSTLTNSLEIRNVLPQFDTKKVLRVKNTLNVCDSLDEQDKSLCQSPTVTYTTNIVVGPDSRLLRSESFNRSLQQQASAGVELGVSATFSNDGPTDAKLAAPIAPEDGISFESEVRSSLGEILEAFFVGVSQSQSSFASGFVESLARGSERIVKLESDASTRGDFGAEFNVETSFTERDGASKAGMLDIELSNFGEFRASLGSEGQPSVEVSVERETSTTVFRSTSQFTDGIGSTKTFSIDGSVECEGRADAMVREDRFQIYASFFMLEDGTILLSIPIPAGVNCDITFVGESSILNEPFLYEFSLAGSIYGEEQDLILNVRKEPNSDPIQTIEEAAGPSTEVEIDGDGGSIGFDSACNFLAREDCIEESSCRWRQIESACISLADICKFEDCHVCRSQANCVASRVGCKVVPSDYFDPFFEGDYYETSYDVIDNWRDTSSVPDHIRTFETAESEEFKCVSDGQPVKPASTSKPQSSLCEDFRNVDQVPAICQQAQLDCSETTNLCSGDFEQREETLNLCHVNNWYACPEHCPEQCSQQKVSEDSQKYANCLDVSPSLCNALVPLGCKHAPSGFETSQLCQSTCEQTQRTLVEDDEQEFCGQCIDRDRNCFAVLFEKYACNNPPCSNYDGPRSLLGIDLPNNAKCDTVLRNGLKVKDVCPYTCDSVENPARCKNTLYPGPKIRMKIPCRIVDATDGNLSSREKGNFGRCVFPFFIGDKQYNKCLDMTEHPLHGTSVRSETGLWCPTTRHYQNDDKWGMCDCPSNEHINITVPVPQVCPDSTFIASIHNQGRFGKVLEASGETLQFVNSRYPDALVSSLFTFTPYVQEGMCTYRITATIYPKEYRRNGLLPESFYNPAQVETKVLVFDEKTERAFLVSESNPKGLPDLWKWTIPSSNYQGRHPHVLDGLDPAQWVSFEVFEGRRHFESLQPQEGFFLATGTKTKKLSANEFHERNRPLENKRDHVITTWMPYSDAIRVLQTLLKEVLPRSSSFCDITVLDQDPCKCPGILCGPFGMVSGLDLRNSGARLSTLSQYVALERLSFMGLEELNLRSVDLEVPPRERCIPLRFCDLSKTVCVLPADADLCVSE